jgi:hypothetical protein
MKADRMARTRRYFIFLLSLFGSLVLHAEDSTYYIDAVGGSDDADGRSEKSAWQTLDRANDTVFGPGDKLLLKAGCRWAGQLKLQGSGTEESPIHVGRYGEGNTPHIAGEGKACSAVMLHNGSHWVIEDLEVTNTIPNGKRRNRMTGVLVEANSGGVFENIVLRRLHVQHVSGDWDRQGGCGILASASGDQEDGSAGKSRFDGLLIEDCYVHHVSFYGIMVSGWDNRFRDKRWFPSTGTVVRNNLTHDTGGDSIVVISCDRPRIENNEGHRSAIGQSKGGKTHAAGMWPHSCDGTVMRYNKVVGIDAAKDGQAFDVDINCRNTLIEYNWSERNTSGFLLLCSPNNDLPGTSNVVVRNNLSIDDGAGVALFKFVTDVVDVTIENNALINSGGAPRKFMKTWAHPDNKGWTTDVLFTNNIFSTPGTFDYAPVSWVDPTFAGNAYAGTYQDFPADTAGTPANAPAVRVDEGVVSANYEGSTFKPFDISKAGLLPTSSWIKQRDDSLRESLE